jgi:NAD(P)H-dependent FMN reductase
MYKLKIISGSTRPGRKGKLISQWIEDVAGEFTGFTTRLIDLAEVNLPLLDEPNHPKLHTYLHEHTKNWSKTIDETDAFIMVSPEYNHSFSAPLKNAIDFLYHEWQYKPVAIVSYGGLSGGARATEALRPVLGAVNLLLINKNVHIPYFRKYLNGDTFVADELLNESASTMFRELLKWTSILWELRSRKESFTEDFNPLNFNK